MDLGRPSSYELLSSGTAVYSSDGERIGTVSQVLAAEDLDIFDGLVISEGIFGAEHRFAEADDVDEIFEQGVVLKLDRTACGQLPASSPNPAAMRTDPGAGKGDSLGDKLQRAWHRISGKS
jgi:uncharacterized protein YrrD